MAADCCRRIDIPLKAIANRQRCCRSPRARTAHRLPGGSTTGIDRRPARPQAWARAPVRALLHTAALRVAHHSAQSVTAFEVDRNFDRSAAM